MDTENIMHEEAKARAAQHRQAIMDMTQTEGWRILSAYMLTRENETVNAFVNGTFATMEEVVKIQERARTYQEIRTKPAQIIDQLTPVEEISLDPY